MCCSICRVGTCKCIQTTECNAKYGSLPTSSTSWRSGTCHHAKHMAVPGEREKEKLRVFEGVWFLRHVSCASGSFRRSRPAPGGLAAGIHKRKFSHDVLTGHHSDSLSHMPALHPFQETDYRCSTNLNSRCTPPGATSFRS